MRKREREGGREGKRRNMRTGQVLLTSPAPDPLHGMVEVGKEPPLLLLVVLFGVGKGGR
jgi:hypothetical protein